MKTKHEYHKAMWAAILASPKADAPKLAMADWLDESQVDRYLMIGLRWCVAKRKWPNSGRAFFWWGSAYRNKGDLPKYIVDGWRQTAKKPMPTSSSISAAIYMSSSSLQHLVRRVGQAAEWVDQHGGK